MKRRTFIVGGSGVVFGLAGCLDEEADHPESRWPDGVVDASISTVGTDCAGPDAERFEADLGETVTIDGTLPSPTPCYEAVLAEISLNGGLSATIDVEETLADDEACAQCAGEVSYELTAELGQAVEQATLEHATGGTYSIENAREYPDPMITESEIETTNTDCGTDDDAAATIQIDDETVSVTGTVIAGNPCHEAVIAGTSIDDSRLDVEIALESTLEEGEACVTCVGAIDYEATITVSEIEGLESVSVSHPDGTSYASGRGSATDGGT